MLTLAEYTNLWNTYFASVVPVASNPIGCPADYSEYINRENMLQDYLDIFRGINTRGNIKFRATPPFKSWYYLHPFFDSVTGKSKLKKRPCIKYILIAEAPPDTKQVVLKTNCLIAGGDKNNSFFYNILHLKNTDYFSAPLKAFGLKPKLNCPENKINGLLELVEISVP